MDYQRQQYGGGMGGTFQGVDSFLSMIPELVISGVIVVITITVLKFLNGDGGSAIAGILEGLADTFSSIMKSAQPLMWISIIGSAATGFLTAGAAFVHAVRGPGTDTNNARQSGGDYFMKTIISQIRMCYVLLSKQILQCNHSMSCM